MNHQPVAMLCQEPGCDRLAVATAFIQHLDSQQWCQHNYCQHHLGMLLESANKRNIPVKDGRTKTQHKGHIQ